MLLPLYEAVYERLEVGSGTRLLGLGCGSGLALVRAAARGAAVTGVESAEPELLALARERLATAGTSGPGRVPRLVAGGPGDVQEAKGAKGSKGAKGARSSKASKGSKESKGSGSSRTSRSAKQDVKAGGAVAAYDVVTAFRPIGCVAGDSDALVEQLEEAGPLAARGAAVVLVGWGPPERCATASVLRVAARLAEPLRGGWRPAHRDDLEDVAARAGLVPDGSGRVACPFGYADVGSAVRGLLSTGLFDAAVAASDAAQVEKELVEALHPYLRADGTVWMANVFRYLVARTK